MMQSGRSGEWDRNVHMKKRLSEHGHVEFAGLNLSR